MSSSPPAPPSPPSDDPPKATLVALRDGRERAIARLADAFAGDLLDVDEFERRLTLAHRAQSPAELEPLIADLAQAETDAPAKSTALALPKAASPARVRNRARIVAVMGGATRRGQWVPARRLEVLAIMGGVVLDFREASFGEGVTEVNLVAMMGGVHVIVPPTLAVEMEGSAFMGGFEHSERAPVQLDPDRPLLRVTGFALMGGVHIETRLPGEPLEHEHGHDQRRMERRERREQRERALEHRQQRALPPRPKEE